MVDITLLEAEDGNMGVDWETYINYLLICKATNSTLGKSKIASNRS